MAKRSEKSVCKSFLARPRKTIDCLLILLALRNTNGLSSPPHAWLQLEGRAFFSPAMWHEAHARLMPRHKPCPPRRPPCPAARPAQAPFAAGEGSVGASAIPLDPGVGQGCVGGWLRLTVRAPVPGGPQGRRSRLCQGKSRVQRGRKI